MKKTFSTLVLVASAILVNAQVGVNTQTPAATLDVVGKPSVASTLDGIIPPRLTGSELRAKTYSAAQTGSLVYVTAPDTAPAGQTVNVTSKGLFSFDGTVWTAVSTASPTAPVGTGTVIYVNGQQQIAQEVSVRMNADWTAPAGTNSSIGNIQTEMIDNFNTFTGTSSGNSFSVNVDGTYLAIMNFSLQANPSAVNGNCTYGIWNVTDGVWVAENVETNIMNAGALKNMAFSVAMDLQAGKTYSFYINQSATSVLVRGQIAGVPSTFFSIKRLK
ncbi:hypothetical protein [Chryseobacterium culicis]|uniref:C1q domain-containing protein n=1 Tax=Chryseobacterium culicis TaxID=680127 RepID=A0A1H6I741_CHRCI|nr:hypothetical protein [Chryseobacterium culicis]SEH44921.1 hypothetical protein SAMN05421593_4250 [Chryseobacterium culicis]